MLLHWILARPLGHSASVWQSGDVSGVEELFSRQATILNALLALPWSGITVRCKHHARALFSCSQTVGCPLTHQFAKCAVDIGNIDSCDVYAALFNGLKDY